MPDIVATRPVSGAPVETGWGTQVHDAIEGIQTGIVQVAGITNSVTGVGPVVFPRPYAVTPTIVVACGSNVVQSGWNGVTTTGFNCLGRRTDGNATTTSQPISWIATGPLA